MSFTPVQRRDLRLAIGARSVSLFGDEVATFALVLRVRPSGPWAVAAMLMANLVPIVVLSGVVGRLIDRVDNRVLLAGACAAQLVVCVALAAVGSPVPSIVLVGLLGVGQAVTGATWQALLPALVPPDQLGRALGFSQAGAMLALMAAPGGAGLVVSALGTHLPLLVDAATFAVVALAGHAVSTGRTTRTSGERTRLRGWSVVRDNGVLRAVITLLGVSVLLGSTVNVVEVFLVRDVLHASVVWFGVAGTVYAVGLLGGALGAARLRAHRRALVASMLGLSAGLALMGLAPTIGWLLGAGLLTGYCNGVSNVCTSALVAGATEPDLRGRVAGVLSGVVAAAQLGAYATGGALSSQLGPRTIFVLAGVVGLLGPAVLGRAVLHAGRGPDPRPGSAQGPAVVPGPGQQPAVEVEEGQAAEPRVGVRHARGQALGDRDAGLLRLDADDELDGPVTHCHRELIGRVDPRVRPDHPA